MSPLARLSAVLAAAFLPALALAQERAEPATGYRWIWVAALLAVVVVMIALFFRAPRRGPPPGRRSIGA